MSGVRSCDAAERHGHVRAGRASGRVHQSRGLLLAAGLCWLAPRSGSLARSSRQFQCHASGTRLWGRPGPRSLQPARIAGSRGRPRRRDWLAIPSQAAAGSKDSGGPAVEGSGDGVVFGGSYVGYAACYLARNNAAVVKAPLMGMLSTGAAASLPLTTVLGVLDAGFLVAYTVGSFVVPAALDLDHRDPWAVVWSALALAGASQLALCGAWVFLLAPCLGLGQIGVALGCCAVNGAAQSVLYPACKQLMAASFGANGTVLGLWNTCYYLGGVASTLLSAAACEYLGWPAAFLVPGALLLFVAGCGSVAGAFTRPEHGRRMADTGNRVAASANAGAAGTRHGVEERLLQLLWPPCRETRVVALQYFSVKLIRYAFGLWLPLLLATGHVAHGDVPLLEVAGTAALFDVGAIIGSLALGAQVERAGLAALPWLVLAATVCLSLLLPAVPFALGLPPLGPPALILLLGLATGGAETLLGSVSPIHYAQRSGSSVSSAVASVNGYGSLGTVAAALALPLLAGAGTGAAPDLAAAFARLAPLAWLAVGTAALQAVAQWREEEAAKAQRAVQS